VPPPSFFGGLSEFPVWFPEKGMRERVGHGIVTHAICSDILRRLIDANRGLRFKLAQVLVE
jgi:hypothetical protein